MTPAAVHGGHAPALIEIRAQTLNDAFAAHPERFKGRLPTPAPLPEAVWINPPAAGSADPQEPPEQH